MLATLTRLFPLWALLLSVLAYYTPSTFTPVGPWVTTLLMLIMFGMGVHLKLDDFKRVLSRPAPVAVAVQPDREGWQTVLPVPAGAPAPVFRHYHRPHEAIVHTAEYRIGEDLHGYVVRFATSDGGKEALPYTYCKSDRDGSTRWTWRQWDEPRPLFARQAALEAA